MAAACCAAGEPLTYCALFRVHLAVPKQTMAMSSVCADACMYQDVASQMQQSCDTAQVSLSLCSKWQRLAAYSYWWPLPTTIHLPAAPLSVQSGIRQLEVSEHQSLHAPLVASASASQQHLFSTAVMYLSQVVSQSS